MVGAGLEPGLNTTQARRRPSTNNSLISVVLHSTKRAGVSLNSYVFWEQDRWTFGGTDGSLNFSFLLLGLKPSNKRGQVSLEPHLKPGYSARTWAVVKVASGQRGTHAERSKRLTASHKLKVTETAAERLKSVAGFDIKVSTGLYLSNIACAERTGFVVINFSDIKSNHVAYGRASGDALRLRPLQLLSRFARRADRINNCALVNFTPRHNLANLALLYSYSCNRHGLDQLPSNICVKLLQIVI